MEGSMKNRISQIVNSVRPDIQFNVGEDTQFFGVLDSFDVVLIVEELEKQLGIIIEAEEIVPDNFASLSVLDNFVRSRSK